MFACVKNIPNSKTHTQKPMKIQIYLGIFDSHRPIGNGQSSANWFFKKNDWKTRKQIVKKFRIFFSEIVWNF